jgi:uncharacterized protein (TIGR03089 family)
VAHLLVDDCRLVPGDHVALLLPPHWQTAAILLGAWSAGLSVGIRLAATAGLAPAGLAAQHDPDVVFVSRQRLNDPIEQVPAAPVRFLVDVARQVSAGEQTPEGYRGFLPAVCGYSAEPLQPADRYSEDELEATTDGTTFAELRLLAQAIASRRGIGPGDRVLCDVGQREHPTFCLLTPLLAGASVVLCANADPRLLAERLETERITHRL